MPLELNSGEGFQTAVTRSVSALNAEVIAQTRAETKKLVDSAESGGFRISPEGVEPLKQALARMQERLDSLAYTTIFALKQEPKLGSHAYGKTVANHSLKGAVEDPGSASMVIEKLRNILEDAGKALDLAVANYLEHEHGIAQTLKRRNI